MASKIFNASGYARTNEQEQASARCKRQLTILIKAPTWKRAHELYNQHQGFISLKMLRDYASISGNKAQLEVSCDAEEGVWWKPLDFSGIPDADAYREIWSKPLLP